MLSTFTQQFDFVIADHKSCFEETDTFPLDSDSTGHSFCGEKCGEVIFFLGSLFATKTAQIRSY